MKKALVTILILGLLGAGGYGAYYHFFADGKEQGGRVSSTSEDAVYVDLISEITGFESGTGLHDRYGGEVEPQATLEVKLESERTVEKCYVKVGDKVKEGQKLFTYDIRDDEDKLAQAEIEIERCKSDIEICKEEIAQYEKDIKSADDEDEKRSYTTQILTAQNTIKRTEYEIKSLELEIEQLKETMKNATVYAEMAGLIQKITDPNEANYSYSYSDNDNAYITILAEGDYRIKGSVNEQNLNQLYTGMPVLVFSRVDENLTWDGVISEIKTDNAEEEDENSYYYGGGSDSSNYAFYVEMENSDGLILGQHVYMEENVGQKNQKEGLWLEEYYILQENGEAYVWLANTSNVIEKHPVTLGEYDEDLMKYEITQGLEADDYIAYPTGVIEAGAPVIYNDYSVQSGTGVDTITDLPYDDYDDFNDGSYSDDSGMNWFDSSVYDGSVVDDVAGYDADYFEIDDEAYYDADEEVGYDADEEMIYDADAEEFIEFGAAEQAGMAAFEGE